eukprot:9490666-Pyramimonas_sp.AAC.1
MATRAPVRYFSICIPRAPGLTRKAPELRNGALAREFLALQSVADKEDIPPERGCDRRRRCGYRGL